MTSYDVMWHFHVHGLIFMVMSPEVHNPFWMIAVDGVRQTLRNSANVILFHQDEPTDLQHDLIELDLGFQVGGATFHHDPLPKPTPTDTTRPQIITSHFRWNTTHNRHRILQHFHGYRYFPNKVRLYYRLLPVMTNSRMPITWWWNITYLLKAPSTAWIRRSSSS